MLPFSSFLKNNYQHICRAFAFILAFPSTRIVMIHKIIDGYVVKKGSLIAWQWRESEFKKVTMAVHCLMN